MTVIVLIALLATSPTAAQRRPMGSTPADNTVGATVSLKVGAAAYRFTGQARCEHMPKGSIYDTVAERWSVNQNEGGKSLMLNVWKPLAGGENLVTLHLSTGTGKPESVDTAAPEKQGTGSVTMAPEGKGGTFTIDATTKAGTRISGTIKCDAFTAAEAVAGE